MFPALCRAQGLPEPVAEHRFASHVLSPKGRPRQWRFDWCWPAQKVALEVEGAVWVAGRHTRGSGFVKDMEKYNTATMLGWRVVRCVPKTLMAPETFNLLRKLLRAPLPQL